MPGSEIVIFKISVYKPSLEPESRTLVVMEWDSEART